MADHATLFRLFARMLDYPQVDLPHVVRHCEASIVEVSPEAAALLEQFRVFVAENTPARLQEIYTATFDLNAACPPYVGYHLFGDSYKRSVFILELNARYQAQGFSSGSELPDHLAVMLSFLADCSDPALADEIIRDALLPALRAMTHDDEQGQVGPYGWVLNALRLVIDRKETVPC